MEVILILIVLFDPVYLKHCSSVRPYSHLNVLSRPVLCRLRLEAWGPLNTPPQVEAAQASFLPEAASTHSSKFLPLVAFLVF